MRKPLLIEIGVEELPAIPFLKELPNIKEKWLNILQEYQLHAEFDFYFTPRRVIFFSDAFLLKQPDRTTMLYGAPVEIAYKDGKPTNAALSFAKKCGVDVKDLKSAIKNSKEVIAYKKESVGKYSKELLPIMIDKFLKDLDFKKSMRWSSNSQSFIRPIRWIGILLGDELVEAEIFGVKSNLITYGHRGFGYEPISYSSIEEFKDILKNRAVIIDPDKRRDRILNQFKELEREHGFEIELDNSLLEEVVAITEYPNALLGKFDKEFLKLPPEVIIASMKEHQRYFPIFRENKLSENFIVVSNAVCDDFRQIIKGNEKVLYPRLSDAMFFYNNDIKNPLNNEGLKNITFMQKLGSIYDKSLREEKIAQYLLKDDTLREDMTKAVMYAKADLLTDMVYEFTELQGLMGYYYAKEAGDKEHIALAYKEQYLPDSEDSKLPSTDFSAIVALANKLDTILALFSIDKIPTGTKDPFGVRRAVVGVVKIVINREFKFNLDTDLKSLERYYDGVDHQKLVSFFLERISRNIDANPSVIQAVFKSNERDILEIYKKVDALNQIVQDSEFKNLFSTFKRVANIIKDIKLDSKIDVDPSLFESEHERELHRAYLNVIESEYKSYKDRLDALFGLKSEIDSFFDHVMVNVDDQKLKTNRKNLIGLIYQSFRDIADIKEISI